MLAIIGGTGLTEIDRFELQSREQVVTAYAEEPITIELFTIAGQQVAFLPRHGKSHAIPPHKVNYRANIAALKQAGVTQILAINAVGGIHQKLAPGSFIVPNQIIDYTHGRVSTFFEEQLEEVVHIDFAEPFDQSLRQRLLVSVGKINKLSEVDRLVMDGGCYGCTQGPRLETAAEIVRMKNDGCDIVGMTAMPEAALAREKELPYVILAQSVNWAAGMYPQEITMDEIRGIVAQGMDFISEVLIDLVQD